MITEDEIFNNIELSNFDKKNDFFGFEASKRKVFIIQEENRISDIEVKIKYDPNRVFVNNGDSYHGKYIVQEISNVTLKYMSCIHPYNELIEHISNENFEPKIIQYQNEISNQILQNKEENTLLNEEYETKSVDTTLTELKINAETGTTYENTIKVDKQEIQLRKYNIVTTITNKLHINNEKFEYLKYMKKIVIPNNKKILMKEIRKCAIIVYDISLDKNQIPEAILALQEIIEEIHYIKNHPKSSAAKKNGTRVFILISSKLTWALTTNKNNAIPITSADYKCRICHPNFQDYYDLENYILQLNNKYCGYFNGIVLATGLVYGHGEHSLKYIYKTAFNVTKQLFIPEHHNNLPIIHVENLAKIVKNLVINYDTLITPYIVGVETSMFSLRNITEAIKEQVHKTNYVYCDYSSLFLNSSVTQTVYDMITMSIQIVPIIDNYITGFISLDRSIPRIFTQTAELISEYLHNQFQIKNIIINGPEEVTNFAKKLAHTYNLNFIDPVTISEEFLYILETSIDHTDFLTQLENMSSSKIINQTSTTFNNMTSFHAFSMQYTKFSSSSSEDRENKDNNQPIYGNNELLDEQKKQFQDKGQISNKYLLPYIKHKILNDRGNKYGYIINNFPETIQQAENLFDLRQLTSKSENINTNFIKEEIHPTFIIDVVMAGKNVINKVMYYSETEQLSSDFYSKLLFDDQLSRLQCWFSLDSKYSENEIMKHILENNDIEIRKNRKVVDYLEALIKPNVHKEYILINPNNFMLIKPQEFDKLFDSLLTSLPLNEKVIEDENDISYIKAMISKLYPHKEITKNIVLKRDDDINEKQTAKISKKDKIDEEHLLVRNIKLINFLNKCVNPIIVNGLLEIITNMPEDPIDFLVEYIYNHNMYNPCISSPLKKKPKVANSLNKHLL